MREKNNQCEEKKLRLSFRKNNFLFKMKVQFDCQSWFPIDQYAICGILFKLV